MQTNSDLEIEIERRDLNPEDVLIKIAFAGICHSDIHTGRGEWGEGNYPLVPGHEIAGTVEEIQHTDDPVVRNFIEGRPTEAERRMSREPAA